MARQMRSTSAIIGRFAAVIGAIVLIHVTARLLHMWGFMAVHEHEYIDTPEFRGYVDVPISFWDMDVNSFASGWFGLIFVYLGAIVLLAVVAGIIAGLIAGAKWLLFRPQYDPGCRNRKCPCVEHKDKVFYSDGKYWDYPPDPSSNLALGIAVGVATGVAIGSSS